MRLSYITQSLFYLFWIEGLRYWKLSVSKFWNINAYICILHYYSQELNISKLPNNNNMKEMKLRFKSYKCLKKGGGGGLKYKYCFRSWCCSHDLQICALEIKLIFIVIFYVQDCFLGMNYNYQTLKIRLRQLRRFKIQSWLGMAWVPVTPRFLAPLKIVFYLMLVNYLL